MSKTNLDAIEFQDLIGAVYDASIDSALWHGLLPQLTAALGGETATLISSPQAALVQDIRAAYG